MEDKLQQPMNLEEELDELDEDSFDHLLAQLYLSFSEKDYTYEEAMHDDLHTLVTRAKEDMDVNNYVSILFICAKRYEHEDNERACGYCVMRLQEIMKASIKKKKISRFLRMNTIEECSTRDNYIEDKTAFIKGYIKELDKKLKIMTLIAAIFLFVMLTWLLSMVWYIALVEALVLSALTYGLNRLRLPKMFWRKQLEAFSKSVEPELLELDVPIRVGK